MNDVISSEKIEESVFSRLSEEDVNEFVETKGKFKYLSWSDALKVLLSIYPDSTWAVKRFGENQLPYLKCDNGCFVETSLTINGITRSELLPVLDFRNNPIENPNTFQVNTSIKRCLTKTMSLHGLGLYIYCGEDFPDVDEDTKSELRELLKKVSKYSEDAEKYLNTLTTKQLREKIAEYNSK